VLEELFESFFSRRGWALPGEEAPLSRQIYRKGGVGSSVNSLLVT
jgi:hypothetical protein